MASPKRPPSPTQPSPPPGFRGAKLEDEGRTFLIMSYELPEWELPDTLTLAERQVLRATLGGATQAQVAEARGVSCTTIANQLAAGFRKLRVGSRMQLAARVRRPSSEER